MARNIDGVILRGCEIVQQLDPEYWIGWENEAEAIRKGDIKTIVHKIVYCLHEHGIIVAEIHGIIHDKDEHEYINPSTLQTERIKKVPHVDITMMFYSEQEKNADGSAALDDKGHPVVKYYGGTVDQIASAVGIAPNFVGKLGRGRYAYDNRIAYTVHAKDPDKYQYDPNDVYSFGCTKDGIPLFREYIDIYNERIASWKAAIPKKRKVKKEGDLSDLCDKILAGEIISVNQLILTDEYYKLYSNGSARKAINSAFEAARTRRIAEMVRDFKAGKFKKTVIWFGGKSGTGKTRAAHALIAQLQKYAASLGMYWRVANLASRNAMDEYDGQEIILLDDTVPGAMDEATWKTFLDPNYVSAASARYFNKGEVVYRLCIITSVNDVETFFGEFEKESIDQFVRRINPEVFVVQVDESDEIFYRVISPVAQNGTDYRRYRYADGEWVRGTDTMVARCIGAFLEKNSDISNSLEMRDEDSLYCDDDGNDDPEMCCLPATVEPAEETIKKAFRAFIVEKLGGEYVEIGYVGPPPFDPACPPVAPVDPSKPRPHNEPKTECKVGYYKRLEKNEKVDAFFDRSSDEIERDMTNWILGKAINGLGGRRTW